MLKIFSILIPVLFYLSFYFGIWERVFTNHCNGAWLCIPGSFIYPVMIWLVLTCFISLMIFLIPSKKDSSPQGKFFSSNHFLTPLMYYFISFGLVLWTLNVQNSNRVKAAYEESYELKLKDTLSAIKIIKPSQNKERVLVENLFEVEVWVRPDVSSDQILSIELMSNDNAIKLTTKIPYVGLEKTSQYKIYRGVINFKSQSNAADNPKPNVITQTYANLSVFLIHNNKRMGDSIEVLLIR